MTIVPTRAGLDAPMSGILQAIATTTLLVANDLLDLGWRKPLQPIELRTQRVAGVPVPMPSSLVALWNN